MYFNGVKASSNILCVCSLFSQEMKAYRFAKNMGLAWKEVMKGRYVKATKHVETDWFWGYLDDEFLHVFSLKIKGILSRLHVSKI